MRTGKRGKHTHITKDGKIVAAMVDLRTFKILNEMAILEDRSVSSLLRIAVENYIRGKRGIPVVKPPVVVGEIKKL